MLQIPLSFKFPRVASPFDLALKLLKSEYPEPKTKLSDFSSLVKFDHQHMLPCLLVKLAY
jgi:hypothetical protein